MLDRQVLGDAHGVGEGRGLGGVGGQRFGEHEGQESEVVGGGRDGKVGIVWLPLPGGVLSGAELAAALNKRGPFRAPHAAGRIEQALLEQADVGGAGEEGDDDDGVNGVGRGEAREDLQERCGLLVDPRGCGGLRGRLLPAEARREEVGGDHGGD